MTDDTELAGKVALVTGASDGIGAATARTLAALGAAVAVNYNTGESRAKELVETITASGGRAAAIQADVTDMEQVASLARQTENVLGPVDVLVLNATGLYGHDVPFVPFEGLSWEFVEYTVTRQLKALYYPLRVTLPAMAMRGTGVVVAVGAALSRTPAAGLLPISMAKGALEAAVKSLAREYGPRGVRVNGVGPGFILSAATEHVPDAFKESAAERASVGRNGLPQDVAETIAFLASPRAAYLNGTYVLVDGGTAMV